MHVDMTKRTHLVIAPPETAIKQHNSVVPQQIVKQTCVTSEIHKDKFDGYVGMTNSKKNNVRLMLLLRPLTDLALRLLLASKASFTDSHVGVSRSLLAMP